MLVYVVAARDKLGDGVLADGSGSCVEGGGSGSSDMTGQPPVPNRHSRLARFRATTASVS